MNGSDSLHNTALFLPGCEDKNELYCSDWQVHRGCDSNSVSITNWIDVVIKALRSALAKEHVDEFLVQLHEVFRLERFTQGVSEPIARMKANRHSSHTS